MILYAEQILIQVCANQIKFQQFQIYHSKSDKKITQKSIAVTIGIASETLNDWADEEAGLEAVQRVLDSLDDIHALQDEYVDEDVLRDMLSDNRLSALLQVHLSFDNLFDFMRIVFQRFQNNIAIV